MTGQRLKGFSEGIEQGLVASGRLHEADISQLGNAVILNSEVGQEHLDAVRCNVPVIAADAIDRLRGAYSVVPFPDKIIDSDRSAHAVGFGEFRDRRSSLMKVALKPFKSPEDAINEARGYLWLGSIGVQTYQPIGIFPAKHGNHVIAMTKTRKDLISLDRGEWVSIGRVENAYDADIAERNKLTVKAIAEQMADIHSKGGFLPDGQIKNWAVTPEGTIGAIDTEHFIHLTHDHDDTTERAWHDVNKLIKSLTLDTTDVETKMFGVGMFDGLSLDQLRNSVEDLFIKPYTLRLEKIFENTADDGQLQRCITLTEGLLTRFYSDIQWPSHFMVQNQHRATRAKG